MNWEIKFFSATTAPPPRKMVVNDKTVELPALPALPRRVSHFVKVPTTSWDQVIHALEAYLLKVAEVLPQFYAGNDEPDPLAADVVAGTLRPENGWDRIVFILDIIYGKVTTNLWAGSQQPREVDRMWVIAVFPMIDQLTRSLYDADENADTSSVDQKLRSALTTAMQREPVRRALQGLRAWRGHTLWSMQPECPETLTPIGGSE